MTIPPKLWHQVFDEANGCCEYCGQDLLISRATYASAQVDHVVARAEDGKDERENLRLACSLCNSSLSRYNHLKTFEERKAHLDKLTKEVHEPNYQDKLSRLGMSQQVRLLRSLEAIQK